MLTETQRYEVGERWLAAEMRANYFADLCSRYLSRQKWITVAILFCSSGAATTVLNDNLPPKLRWMRPVFALFTAGLSLLSFVQRYPETSADCAELHSTWNHLATQYEMLWNDMDSADANDQLKRLIERGTEASKRGAKIPYKEKLMRKWQEHVEMHHSNTS